jgi:type VI secretion system secreted protein VgrG
MGARSTPTSPSAGPGAGQPASGTVAPCCWCDDYEKEISVLSTKYATSYAADGTVHGNYGASRKFKLYAPVKTGSKITVEVRFLVAPDAGVSAADVAAAKTKVETGVNTHWNNKFKLEATDLQCPKKTFDIEYKVVWVTSGAHYTLRVHPTYPREGVSGLMVDVSATTNAWTYAHEFGHCVGLPDEYSYVVASTETVKYIKPDGSLDAAIVAPYNGKSATAPDATLMAANGNTVLLKRHAWNVAIETQELLTAKLGRPIKCDIIAP